MKVIYKNIITGKELTEKEYEDLLQREGEELWEGLNHEEKAEWESRVEYIEKTKEGIDTDFEKIIIE